MQSPAAQMPRDDAAAPAAHRSVARVTAIIEAVGAHGAPVRLTDIARQTGLDSGTVHRILAELVARGFLHKDAASRRYSIGFEIFRLGASDPARAITADRAHKFLVRLAGELGATVLIGGREGPIVHLYKKIDGDRSQPLTIGREFNAYLDAHATAIGKVLLAYAAETEVRSLYKENPLRRHTGRTITSVGRLIGELRRIRVQRYARDGGEWHTGLDGFAVPIFNPVGHVNLAIWVVPAPNAWPLIHIDRAVAAASRAAHDIIRYATGKPPLTWPHASGGARPAEAKREETAPC